VSAEEHQRVSDGEREAVATRLLGTGVALLAAVVYRVLDIEHDDHHPHGLPRPPRSPER
jgi:hypothetical protein